MKRHESFPSQFMNALCVISRCRSHCGREARLAIRRRSFALALCVALLFVVGSPGTAMADPISVQYSVSQINPTTWEYQYFVVGALLANEGVAVYFPLNSEYGAALSDASVATDWLTFALDAAPAIPAAGEWDAVANVDNPATGTFLVSFTWSGATAPGSQPFTVFDFNVAPAAVLENGTTTLFNPASVPEPGTLLLLATGATGLIARRPRSRN
jgi:hypothetical protein